MTPPARPDPVAALNHALTEAGRDALGYAPKGGLQGVAQKAMPHLTEQGYVLVNADMLAAALHAAGVGCEWNPVGRATHDGDHERDASRVFAALKGPAR